MAWGRPSGPAPRFPATVFVGNQGVQVRVGGIGNEPITDATPWAVIATNISNGTITQELTADGSPIIINWPHVQAVTY